MSRERWILLHVYGGAAFVAAGAWVIYPPAGVVVAGALVLFLGLRGAQ